MRISILLSFLLMLHGSFLISQQNKNSKKRVVLHLVHGTWGKDSLWHSPDSQFCTELTLPNVTRFLWSGKFSHKARVIAAKQFAEHLKQYDAQTELIVIAHSHGVNVTFLAAQQLRKNQRIAVLYSLAAPINTDRYAPNMDKIDYIYNLFSLSDHIQPVLGFYERVLPPHERVANFSISINGKKPGHNDFLTPTLAVWLPQLHSLCTKKEASFALFTYNQPGGCLSFYQQQKPIYSADAGQQRILEKDKKYQEKLLQEFYYNTIQAERYPQQEVFSALDVDFFETQLEKSYKNLFLSS